YKHINSLESLHAERLKLKATYEAQGDHLKEYAGEYIRQFNPINLFKKYFTKDSFDKIDSKTNISGKVMSLVLPLLLNKTLFRGSGFITKALVGLASNKLGKKLDLDHLTGIAETVKNWFVSKAPKRAKEVDYGIPPDSETY
ncbi:MAG: hypothetical protein EOO89_29225, partial [Pedobacter sp.]